LSVTTPFPSIVVRVLVSEEDPDSGTGIKVVDCVVVLVEDDVWATAIPVMRASAVVAARTYRVMSFLLFFQALRYRASVGMTGCSDASDPVRSTAMGTDTTTARPQQGWFRSQSGSAGCRPAVASAHAGRKTAMLLSMSDAEAGDHAGFVWFEGNSW